MTINSRQKGARGEREWAQYLTEQGFKAHRGVQYQGSPDSPDVVCSQLDAYHFEVKRREAGNPYVWLKQAVNESGGKVPVVAHRRNGEAWMVIMRAEDLLKILVHNPVANPPAPN